MSYFSRLSKLTSLEKITDPTVTYDQISRKYNSLPSGNLAAVNARIAEIEQKSNALTSKALLDQYTQKLETTIGNSLRAYNIRENLRYNIIAEKKKYIKAIKSASESELEQIPIQDLTAVYKKTKKPSIRNRIKSVTTKVKQTAGYKIPVTLINLATNRVLKYDDIINSEAITGHKMIFGNAKIALNDSVLQTIQYPVLFIPEIKKTYNNRTLTDSELKGAFPKTMKVPHKRTGIIVENPTGIEYKQQFIRIPHGLTLSEKHKLIYTSINKKNYHTQVEYFKPVDYLILYDRKPKTRADKILDKVTSADFINERIDYSITKIPNLGDAPVINCVMDIIKNHISEETYEHFKNKPRLTEQEIRYIAKKERITINFYDILKYPWARTSHDNKQKQFNIIINNNHAIQCKIEDEYTIITEDIIKNSSATFFDGNNIKYYLYNDKTTNTIKRIFNKYLYQRNENDLKPGQKIITKFASEIIDRLPYDNKYTENLPYIYPGCTIINNEILGDEFMFDPVKEGIYAYDSNKHFQKKLSEDNVLPYPPNQYKILNVTANQNNIPEELFYNGFVYINNIKTDVKYIKLNYKENCCLYSKLLLFMLKQGVIECNIYAINYNKQAQNIDLINMAFMETFDLDYLKEFNQPGCHKPVILEEGEILLEDLPTTENITLEKERAHKILFNTTIGMLKKSTAKAKQFQRIQIKTKDLEERKQLFASHEFVSEDGDEFINVHQEKEKTERQYYNYMWYAVIQLAEISFLELYLTLDESKISHTYVDCIYTKEQIEPPIGWKLEDKDRIYKRKNRETKSYELPTWEEEIINDTIRQGPGGCGKTYQLLVKPPTNAIVITNTRNLLEEHKKTYADHKTDTTNELHFATSNKFFNVTTKYPYKQGMHYSTIIFDEVGLETSDLYYSHMREYILTHRYQNFIFTRGMRQLFATNSTDYIHKHIIADINPNIVEFTENRRILCEELKQRINMVKDKTNNQEWLQTFADRVIDKTTMFDIYDPNRDVGIASRNIRIDELNNTAVNIYDVLVESIDGKVVRKEKPIKINKTTELAYFQTFHKQQGNTIRQPSKLFVILDRLFDIYMLDMSIGRVQYLDQIYLVQDKSYVLRNTVDEFDCDKQSKLEHSGLVPHNIIQKNTLTLPPIYQNLKSNIKNCIKEIEKRKEYFTKRKTKSNIVNKYKDEIKEYERDLAYYSKCIIPFIKIENQIKEQKKNSELIESKTRYEQYQQWLRNK